MTTVNTTGRFVGDWPKIGIRPAVDGRMHGVRESLEEQTRSDGAAHGGADQRQPALPGRHAGRGRRPGPQHRRRLRGGQGRRALPQGGRGRLDHDHALLVLRLRDDGHGPPDAQGGLGLQRHRAAGRGLPRRRPRRAHPEGPAGVRHLRARRPGRRPTARSRTTCRRRSCASRGPAWPPRSCAASRTSPSAASRWASPGSIVDQPFFEKYLGMRVEAVDMSEIYRRLEEGIYDPVEFEKGLAWAKANCREGADRNTPDKQKTPRGARRRLGDGRQDVPHHPRPAGGQPAARRARLRRGGDGPQRDPGRLPGPAPLDRPRAQRRLHGGDPQLAPSTGTGSARRTSSRPRTTRSTARRCCCRYLLTNRAQIFADVRTYWSPDAVERVTGHRPDGPRRRTASSTSSTPAPPPSTPRAR